MKKCVVIPDSFKGSLRSVEVCSIIERQILRAFPACQVLSVPVADGGEGTLECFHRALGGETRACRVAGPFFEEMEAQYWLAPDRETAVVEVAQCVGLPLAEGRKDPGKATTYGVGQMIRAAAQTGAKKILVGLGGSCTNDGGLGMAAALGARFWDAEGRAFVPTGDSIPRIARIDASGISPAVRKAEIVGMCDVRNPLWGENGASRVFGPQKGANPERCEALDRNLRDLDGLLSRDLGKRVAEVPGAGAAGGLGAAILAFLDGALQPGIQTILDLAQFDQIASGADLILTGEGKLDAQSLNGKVIQGVAARAKALGVPVVALVGMLEDGFESLYAQGLTAAFTIATKVCPIKEAQARTAHDIAATMDNLCRLLRQLETGASRTNPCNAGLP